MIRCARREAIIDFISSRLDTFSFSNFNEIDEFCNNFANQCVRRHV